MLSVLIPTYNYKALPLIQEVHKQLVSSSIDFEIICIDDSSEEEFLIPPIQINSLSNTNYNILDKNLGRSKVRNILAGKAKFNWLLFLDSDVKPLRSDFINNYLEVISLNNKVICGGIRYETEKPKSERQLRHKYGKKREEKSVFERKQQPFRYLLASNFLIEKKVFEDIKFNESLTQYGHEDTLLGIDLRKREINILHIENPVFHLGVEKSSVFLKKTEQAVRNALFLYRQNLVTKEDIKLIDKYIRLRFIKKPIVFVFRTFKNQIFKQLNSKNPSLLLFDFYKLAFLYSLKKESL
ncbi:glycosyltransferase [Aureibaculum sp. 2210JD6-5]|uniref:glycosyltransferase family 2 protein n=1 Tax=Aureibaculum sp. 2210JD6-5 TaxID=3103957 RepID=UPI002AAE8114|nr:glycosyltransferase [Aureibaculum sp. 2210JD6-5]MDY7394700.1 glycosyltransferase [Aureibaculum sp. 2210JD6-5]